MGKEKKHKEYKPDKREKYEELPVSRPAGLKLVLKVGGSPVPESSEARAETPPAQAVAPLRLNMAAISEAETHHKERKHKKKKKKEKEKHKHKKERRLLEGADPDHEMSPGPETGRDSRQSSGTEEAPSQGTASSPERCRTVSPPPEPAAAGGAEDASPEGPPLRRFLEHLLRGLQEKDTRGFFSVPVTDDVAPGYSSIIDTPMDFSTIAQKVRDGLYPGLAAFKGCGAVEISDGSGSGSGSGEKIGSGSGSGSG
ncbi:Bromodomain-containing protein 9 [Amphibalanus amphitrite]|uniref:Bromodomain-containing protein 9 n=1 Tax=Amphibalanus amphitrite TaxID=1232801 RepID=A0A6A4VZ88_AMPAM|nr:Bromodomain-containing protein 9 [Amphibalanus amphitrite]KAF0296894.1 Bromodomain-containing protein 9 [Amphibalanus amphitrite]